MSSHEKILETVMSTMTTFTDKLNSMEERLSGLTSRLDTLVTVNKSASRKSRSREKVKRIEISDDDEKIPVTAGLATVSEAGLYILTLSLMWPLLLNQLLRDQRS